MSSYVTLLGAEQVQSAANTMRSAAEEMSRVASSIDYSLQQHRQFMEDWLTRLEGIMQEQGNGSRPIIAPATGREYHGDIDGDGE